MSGRYYSKYDPEWRRNGEPCDPAITPDSEYWQAKALQVNNWLDKDLPNTDEGIARWDEIRQMWIGKDYTWMRIYEILNQEYRKLRK